MSATSLDAEETQNRWFFYGQDQWKVTRKLTVNYGLRWEIYRPQTVTGAGQGRLRGLDHRRGARRRDDGVGLDLNVRSLYDSSRRVSASPTS